jgi:hypothetical protein
LAEKSDRHREKRRKNTHIMKKEQATKSQREITAWVNCLYFEEFNERNTYVWKSIQKISYLKLILIK